MVCPTCEAEGLEGPGKRTAICAYLREYFTGKERAVSSRELERLFSVDGRGLRRKISALRQQG